MAKKRMQARKQEATLGPVVTIEMKHKGKLVGKFDVLIHDMRVVPFVEDFAVHLEDTYGQVIEHSV